MGGLIDEARARWRGLESRALFVWDRYHIFCQDAGGGGEVNLDTRRKIITIVTQNSRTADVAYCNSKLSQEL
jgi:hypothetical protein